MLTIFEDKKNLWFSLAALLFIGLAVVGGVRSYSPVPFWDMWDGYLGFYAKVSDGNWAAWWSQHNEHRIVLARLFFWLDLATFGGQGWFLVFVNYGLMLVVCWCFLKIWQEIESNKSSMWIGYFLAAWLFSWIQNNNLEWGFQSQFILAQLLPLLSFYYLHRACVADGKKYKLFLISIFWGILSIGSMANGILVLPLMVVFALITKMDWRKTLLIGLLAFVCVSLYFFEYKAPSGHGSLRDSILNNPIGLIHYVAIYMGGPFTFGANTNAIWLATTAGVLLIAFSIIFGWNAILKNRQDSLQTALLVFILYVGGTAFGTGGGRLIFGVEQALASRYMTPSLMAWVALFFLFYKNFSALRSWATSKLWVVLSLLLVLMLPQQLLALKSKTEMLYERKLAALALELGIRDQAQIGHVFPSADWALDLVKKPVEQNYSIFGTDPLINLRDHLGKIPKEKNKHLENCIGHLDAVEEVATDQKYLRIRGWLWDEHKKNDGELITIRNLNNQIVGYGLLGHDRPDVAKQINKEARHFGFKAYILASNQGQELFAYNSGMKCQLSVKIPGLNFRIIEHNNFTTMSTISKDAISGTNEWTGKDFHKTEVAGMHVLGSFLNADADTGSVVVKMKRGDRIYYRSGPIADRQTLEIIGTQIKPVVLPKSINWQLLEFSNDYYPETFDAKFSDNGNEWGEWSAIMIRVK